MEQHTVEVTFDGEKIFSVTEGHATTTLYRTPEDTYFVYIDMRNIAEEDVARGIPPYAVLDDGHAGLGHSEAFVRHHWPELFAAQSTK